MRLGELVALTRLITGAACGTPGPKGDTRTLSERIQIASWQAALYRDAAAHIAPVGTWLDGAGPEGESAQRANRTWCAWQDPEAVRFSSWGALMRAFHEACGPDMDYGEMRRLRPWALRPYLRATTAEILQSVQGGHPVRHPNALRIFVRAEELAMSEALDLPAPPLAFTGKPE